MEADLGRDGLEGRGEHGATALLGLALAGLRGGDLLAALLHALEGGGRARQHDTTTGVTDGDDGAALGILALEDLRDDRAQALGVDVGDGEHRVLAGAGDQAAAATDEGRGGTDELGDGEDLGVLAAGGGDGLDGEDALRVADDRTRRDGVDVEALVRERTQCGDLSEEDAGKRHGGGGESGFGGAGGRVVLVGEFGLEDPRDGVEARRTDHDEVARDRGEVRGGAVDQVGEDRFESVVAAELLERGEPGGSLAAECERVGLTREELVDQGTGRSGCRGPIGGAS